MGKKRRGRLRLIVLCGLIGGLLGFISFFVFAGNLNKDHPYEIFLLGPLRELFRSVTGCQYDCLYFMILSPITIGIIGALLGILLGLFLSLVL